MVQKISYLLRHIWKVVNAFTLISFWRTYLLNTLLAPPGALQCPQMSLVQHSNAHNSPNKQTNKQTKHTQQLNNQPTNQNCIDMILNISGKNGMMIISNSVVVM